MKNNRTINFKNILIRFYLSVILLVFFCNILIAQEETKAQRKSESTINLSYLKKADNSKTITAVIKTRNESEKFVSSKNTKVNFYVKDGTEVRLLQNAYTNNKGEAVIILKNDLPLDTGNAFTVIAKIENDKQLEDAEEEIYFKDVNFALKLNPDDTSQLATVIVTEINKEGKEIPVKDTEVKFYVQRLFGIMPANEENTASTDENGEASFIYPKDIPGDTAGVITVIARIEDNERFGNVENKAVTSWGTVLATETDPFPRALWEPSAPLPLIITILILFSGVWFAYFFIFYQLRKIKKETNNS